MMAFATFLRATRRGWRYACLLSLCLGACTPARGANNGETPVLPTSQPTVASTQGPTAGPTTAPTIAPTTAPTTVSTVLPTKTPGAYPAATTATATASIPPPTTTAPGTAAITGLVWHDLCVGGGEPEPPVAALAPLGCVPTTSAGYRANGVYETGEPGIAGVRVALQSGPCEVATELTTTVTDAAGAYRFANLSAGDYCVRIDTRRPENSTVLIPGSWTRPLGGEQVQTAIALHAEEQRGQVSFGWDYQFLPPAAPPLPTSTPAPASGTATIRGAVWQDDCTLQNSPPGPVTLVGGCVEVTGTYYANGVWDASESGWAGIVVSLAPGPCPGEVNGVITTTTDANGAYRFEHLNAGAYCVFVDPLLPPNPSQLVPGTWTFPGLEVGYITMVLKPGENKTKVNFGWDWQLD